MIQQSSQQSLQEQQIINSSSNSRNEIIYSKNQINFRDQIVNLRDQPINSKYQPINSKYQAIYSRDQIINSKNQIINSRDQINLSLNINNQINQNLNINTQTNPYISTQINPSTSKTRRNQFKYTLNNNKNSNYQNNKADNNKKLNKQFQISNNEAIKPAGINNNNNKTCINKICPKYKNKLIINNQDNNFSKLSKQSKHLQAFNPSYLCNQCLTQYHKQAYCLYCKQIYFDSSDDGKEWIECEICCRWVHSQCANYDANFDTDFKCLKCKKISGTDINNGIGNNMNKKQNIKVNSKTNGRKLVECNLNAFGFYWQLGAKELAEDIDKIKQFLQ